MKVRRVKGKKYTPFEVTVPKSITGTRRVRKYFARADEGHGYISRVRRLGYVNADLREPSEDVAAGMLMSECLEAFEARSTEGRRSGTKSQIKLVCRRLKESFGKMGITQVTHRELEPWVNNIEGNYTTRHNHLRVSRRFFQYCVDFLEAVPRNPFKKVQLRDDRQGPTKIETLTPAQLESCLEYALKLTTSDETLIDGRALLGYLTLGGFAGLRTEEILNARWVDLDFEHEEIYVRQPKRVRGWKPRYVRMEPALIFHLKNLVPKVISGESRAERRRPDGTLGPNTAKVVPGGQRTLYTLRRAMMDALGWEKWPKNCLRHSYGTYWLAEFDDLSKLRNLMGHESEDVTRGRYVIAAKKVDRKAYWAMRVRVALEALKAVA